MRLKHIPTPYLTLIIHMAMSQFAKSPRGEHGEKHDDHPTSWLAGFPNGRIGKCGVIFFTDLR